jgi:hypothetical protein
MMADRRQVRQFEQLVRGYRGLDVLGGSQIMGRLEQAHRATPDRWNELLDLAWHVGQRGRVPGV